jgi:hypothetical protein
MICRLATELKTHRQVTGESRQRADQSGKTVRQLNLTIGKLEQKLRSRGGGGVAPLGPNNGKSQYVRTEDEGRQFAVEHTQLISEIEALKEENDSLKLAARESDRNNLVRGHISLCEVSHKRRHAPCDACHCNCKKLGLFVQSFSAMRAARTRQRARVRPRSGAPANSRDAHMPSSGTKTLFDARASAPGVRRRAAWCAQ